MQKLYKREQYLKKTTKKALEDDGVRALVANEGEARNCISVKLTYIRAVNGFSAKIVGKIL